MSAMWIAPAIVMIRMRPSDMSSGATAGSPKACAIGPASRASTPAARTDMASDAQKTVSAIAGVTRLARWIAVASPAAGRILPKSANATASAKTPNASGPSFRASTAKTANERM
jgi:hypothetical protein